MNNVWLNKKRFNKIEITPGLRTMFGPRPYENNPVDYGLDNFTECYHRYFGCGNHLYILVKDYDEEKVLEVGCRQVNPRLMVEDMGKAAKDFRIVMVDVEMGGRNVWMPKENKECTLE